MSKDIILSLIDDLSHLTRTDVDNASDDVLKVLNHMLLTWHVLISQEEDRRALDKLREQVMSGLDDSASTAPIIKKLRRRYADDG